MTEDRLLGIRLGVCGLMSFPSTGGNEFGFISDSLLQVSLLLRLVNDVASHKISHWSLEYPAFLGGLWGRTDYYRSSPPSRLALCDFQRSGCDKRLD